jgi:chemotaxis protein MotB
MDDADDIDVRRAMRSVRTSWTPWVLFIVTAGLGGFAVKHLYEMVELGKKDVAAADQRMTENKAEVLNAERAKSELEKRLDQLQKENAELSTFKEQSAAASKAKEEQGARLKSAQEALDAKLKAEIGAGEVNVSTAEGRLHVDIADKLLFDAPSDGAVSKKGEQLIARIGAVLGALKEQTMEVGVHTDSDRIADKARYPSHWELSGARAGSVAHLLSEKSRLKDKQIVATGYGASRPLAPNNSPANKAKNRRVEIVVSTP